MSRLLLTPRIAAMAIAQIVSARLGYRGYTPAGNFSLDISEPLAFTSLEQVIDTLVPAIRSVLPDNGSLARAGFKAGRPHKLPMRSPYAERDEYRRVTVRVEWLLRSRGKVWRAHVAVKPQVSNG